MLQAVHKPPPRTVTDSELPFELFEATASCMARFLFAFSQLWLTDCPPLHSQVTRELFVLNPLAALEISLCSAARRLGSSKLQL